ncbi:MAG: chemotaxis protein CheW [Thermoanaerobaculales bacterium]
MANQFCTFSVGDLQLGIEIERIHEVLYETAITPVPLAPPSVCGLINLRGQIIAAVDLRKRFGLAEEKTKAAHATLVLGDGDHLLSFVVDRVGDVVEVGSEDYEEPPNTLKGEARRLIRGAYKLQDSLLLVLDVEFALDLGTPEIG